MKNDVLEKNSEKNARNIDPLYGLQIKRKLGDDIQGRWKINNLKVYMIYSCSVHQISFEIVSQSVNINI